MWKQLCLLALIPWLSGCLNMATTGAQMVYNRHSITKNFKDQYITMQAHRALYLETNKFKNTNIAITTYNGEVLMAGQVPEAWQKTAAEDTVRHIDGITELHNLLAVSSPSSTLIRMSDTWITAKVKAKLIASEDVDATQVKVVTENGTVFLMGILKPEDAQAATEVASNTEGVQKVVRIFSYMTISKKLKA